MKSILIFTLVCCFTCSAAQQQLTQIQSASHPIGSNPSQFAAFNNMAFFLAAKGDTGREIWKSDGTPDGTVLVKDINLGSAGSVFSNFVELKGRLYFIADDGLTGHQLWTTDGSGDGTFRVTDHINYQVRELLVHGDHIYFLKKPQENRLEVWKTDGTAEGTVLVKGDIPIINSAYNLFSAIGLVFFTAYEGLVNTTVWRTDGTEEGTFAVAGGLDGNGAGPDGTAHPTQFVEYNGAVYFVARSSFSNGLSVGIVRMDGTAEGTEYVVGIHDGHSHLVEFADVIVHNNRMYFSFFDADLNRLRIWESAGQEENTTNIYDYTGASYFVPSYMCASGEYLYFTSGNTTGGTSLWRLNPSAEDLEEVKALAGAISKPSIFSRDGFDTNTLMADEGRIFVKALRVNSDYAELWVSNGTADGTISLQRTSGREGKLMIAADHLFFAGGTGQDFELWKTNGTSSGTTLVKDIYTTGFGGIAGGPRLLNGAVLFMATHPDFGREPWLTDGTVAGTQCLDLFPGPGGSWPLAFLRAQDKLYFAGMYEAGKLKIYSSDGTLDGTNPVGGFTTSDWRLKLVEKSSGDVFVAAVNAGGTYSLYSIDTVANQLVEIKEFGRNEYNAPYVVNEMVSMDDTIYLLLAGVGTDLWKSDGTPDGTVKVADFHYASQLTVAGNRLYLIDQPDFVSAEEELYSTDGTFAGTAIVKNINGASSANPENLFAFQEQLAFTAFDAASGKEVWITDGTEEGTRILKEINPGPGSSVSSPLFTILDGALYFPAYSPEHGSELWKTDGTTEGTVMLKDIVPGPESSKPSALSRTGGKLYFSAYTPEHGYEVWSTDGTAEGTGLVVDVLPGPKYSNPTGMIALDDVLIFAADTESHGLQMWRYGEDVVTSIQRSDGLPLSVYPNPSSGIFRVAPGTFSGGSAAIYNGQGLCVAMIGNLEDDKEVDLSRMPSGLYLMKFRSGAMFTTVKIIKF